MVDRENAIRNALPSRTAVAQLSRAGPRGLVRAVKQSPACNYDRSFRELTQLRSRAVAWLRDHGLRNAAAIRLGHPCCCPKRCDEPLQRDRRVHRGALVIRHNAP